MAILDFRWKRLYLFLIYRSPQYFLSSFKSIGPSIQERKFQIYFRDGGRGSHLGFPIKTVLTVFDLQIAAIIPSKLRVKWPFGSGEEVPNTFSSYTHKIILAILDFDFSYFDLQVTQFQVVYNWPSRSGEVQSKRISIKPRLPFSNLYFVSKSNLFDVYFTTLQLVLMPCGGGRTSPRTLA